MRKLLLAAVTFGGLTAASALGAMAVAQPVGHRAFAGHETRLRPPVAQVDYYWHRHHWHHRHWEHRHWRYYD
jgi:hypothetical protein